VYGTTASSSERAHQRARADAGFGCRTEDRPPRRFCALQETHSRTADRSGAPSRSAWPRRFARELQEKSPVQCERASRRCREDKSLTRSVSVIPHTTSAHRSRPTVTGRPVPVKQSVLFEAGSQIRERGRRQRRCWALGFRRQSAGTQNGWSRGCLRPRPYRGRVGVPRRCAPAPRACAFLLRRTATTDRETFCKDCGRSPCSACRCGGAKAHLGPPRCMDGSHRRS
jgi:hypothetical protein